MKYIITFLILFISAIGYSQQGNITAQRVQANSNLLPPLDTVLAPYRVGELRTKVSGGDTLIFISISTTAPRKWKIYANRLTAISSLDFPSVAAGTTEVLTITVTGATDGDIATVGVPIASQTTGLMWQAYVSAANTVTVSVTNTTGAPIEPATATFRVSVIKY